MENMENLETSSTIQDFAAFELKPQLLKGVSEAGFTTPSPIQVESIPLILGGHDLIAQAQTGTGKTAAFALPLIQRLHNNGEIEALVITPTRELAMQVSEEIFKLGHFCNTRTVCVYGGQSASRQIELLKKRPQVVIATPGRLLDFLRNDKIPRFNPKIVVLDESDEMLDMGFLEDIEEIFSYLPARRQTLLFSATMPLPIKQLAQKILDNPKLVKIATKETTNSDIRQRYYIINEGEREFAIVRLIDSEIPSKAIIFTRTKKEADSLCANLVARGYHACALHGDMQQVERRNAITAFKDGNVEMLIATDIAARGLDISDVSHVFNYHIPLNPESYVHRIGRTGRAGKKGIAITLTTPLEFKEMRRIAENTKAHIELYEIPSIADTMKSLDSKIIKELLNAPITDEALQIYEVLSDEIQASQLACKLLSLLFARKQILGPDKIGLSKADLGKIEASLRKSATNKPSSRRPRRRSQPRYRQHY